MCIFSLVGKGRDFDAYYTLNPEQAGNASQVPIFCEDVENRCRGQFHRYGYVSGLTDRSFVVLVSYNTINIAKTLPETANLHKCPSWFDGQGFSPSHYEESDQISVLFRLFASNRVTHTNGPSEPTVNTSTQEYNPFQMRINEVLKYPYTYMSFIKDIYVSYVLDQAFS